MWEPFQRSGDREEDEALVLERLRALTEGETDRVAALANASALLSRALERVNWVGFYLWDEARRELVLGPFQGAPACSRIPWGRGVCGRAAGERRILRVGDVRSFPGHIACDAASRSEIAVPLESAGRLLGVLDVDSPEPGRFDERDERFLERVGRLLSDRIAGTGLQSAPAGVGCNRAGRTGPATTPGEDHERNPN